MGDASVDPRPLQVGLPVGVRACLFDLDGVLTRTASVHRAAWADTFDPILREHSQPVFSVADYLRHVDGKPRADGVRDFLASRGIHPAEGTREDPPASPTVGGIANRKNLLLLERLARDGVEVFDTSIEYVRLAREAGLWIAVVTASANGAAVLKATGVDHLVDALVDGNVALAEGLAGKPAPDTFLAGARALGVLPGEGAVFEDAQAGVTAARAGGFGFVVGVDRADQAADLLRSGADIVVRDLAELLPSEGNR